MKLDRRSMLKALGLGLGTALVPMIGGVRRSHAGPAKGPQRLLIITTCNGTVPTEFFPAAAGPLGTLPRVLAPLEPYRDRMNVLQGIGNLICDGGGNDGHSSYLTLLSGAARIPRGFDEPTAGGPSIDQLIAMEYAKDPATKTAFDYLSVGAQSGGRRMSWRGVDRPLRSDDDPDSVFARLFVDGDVQKAARLRQERKSVLDGAASRIGALTPRLGKDDRVKTEAHLDAVRELERQLEAQCAVAPAVPLRSDGQPFDWSDAGTLEVQTKLQLDMMVAAFACDLTRVGLFPNLVTGGEGRYYFLGVEDVHHGLAHDWPGNSAAREKYLQCEVWHASMVRYVCDKLAAASLLDQTLVVWVNEMDSAAHTMRSLPIVMIGDAQGFFRTGQHVQYASTIEHQRWLLTLAHAMGVPVKSVGDATAGTTTYVNDQLLDGIVA